MKSDMKKQQRKLNREIHKFYRYLRDKEPQWYGRFKIKCLPRRQWYPYPGHGGELYVMLQFSDSLTGERWERCADVVSWLSYAPRCFWWMVNDFICQCRLKQIEMGYPDD